MKKIVLALTILAFSSTAFAASKSYVSGSVYSIGSISPAAYKPSPNVTINMYIDDVTKGTDWAAFSMHKNGLSNKKGMAFWTSKSDPGIYYKKGDPTLITDYPAAPSDSAIPSGYTADGN